ncbi:MAG: glycosyltransferase family 2 protein [Shewanella sp.]|nr:glycosyltransferase family 2 protein [Shewanella sp.]
MKNLVSVIMPTYNCETTLEASIYSVVEQTYDAWELIITDDASNCETVAILNSWVLKDSRIKVFFLQNNQGAGACRNNSILHANGRYISFLDSDDLWLPNKLEKQVEFMIENKVFFTCTYYEKFSKDKVNSIIKSPLIANYNDLLSSNSVGCLTAMYDSSYYGKKYMPLIRKRQDLGLWLELLDNQESVYCIPEILAKYRADSGMSRNKLAMFFWQIKFYRQTLNLSYFKIIKIIPRYIYGGLLKSIR